MEIKAITIQPGTMGEITFRIGERNPLGGNVITKVSVEFDPADNSQYVDIEENNEKFAHYVGVPYAAFFK